MTIKKIETLKENKWVSLKKIVFQEPIEDYIFSHETRCKGKIVLVLPYRIDGDTVEVLLRNELTPCWNDDRTFSAVTGGCSTKDPKVDVVRELKEETGYDVKESDLIDLGTCRGTKSTDTIYYLFTVDLTNLECVEAKGDGNELDKAPIVWSTHFDNIQDSQANVAFLRLMEFLQNGRSI